MPCIVRPLLFTADECLPPLRAPSPPRRPACQRLSCPPPCRGVQPGVRSSVLPPGGTPCTTYPHTPRRPFFFSPCHVPALPAPTSRTTQPILSKRRATLCAHPPHPAPHSTCHCLPAFPTRLPLAVLLALTAHIAHACKRPIRAGEMQGSGWRGAVLTGSGGRHPAQRCNAEEGLHALGRRSFRSRTTHIATSRSQRPAALLGDCAAIPPSSQRRLRGAPIC